MNRIYLFTRFNRFWHWAQAVLVALLTISGFETRGYYSVFGFREAVVLHGVCAVAFLILMAFAIFWHFTTGAWRQYMPTRNQLGAQLKFYLSGMFKGEPHPFLKSEISRLNPLQRIVYLKLKLVLIPALVVTGAFYASHIGVPFSFGPRLTDEQLTLVANLHVFCAYSMIAFVVIHVYMTTTGKTPLSNIKAMITGWEDEEKKK